MKVCCAVPSFLIFREFSVSIGAATVQQQRAFEEIEAYFRAPVTVEIYGERQSGKSAFVQKILRSNPDLRSVLIITKDVGVSLENTVVYAVTSRKEVASVLHSVISGFCDIRPLFLCIDTLATVFDAEEDRAGDEEVYGLLGQLNALGVRVIVVSSTCSSFVRRRNEIYAASFCFRKEDRRRLTM